MNVIFNIMHQFKFSVIALAIVVGAGYAFTTSTSPALNKRLNPNWQTTDPSTGNTITVANGGIYEPNRTRAQAQADFGCVGNSRPCASTVNVQDGAPNGIGVMFQN